MRVEIGVINAALTDVQKMIGRRYLRSQFSGRELNNYLIILALVVLRCKVPKVPDRML